ncbi:MAG: TerC family protein [Nibricoccus sp.]
MDSVALFPFGQYWWLYGVFLALVGGLLALDLGVFHRKAHDVSLKEAMVWSVVWIALALLFNWGLYHYSVWAFGHDARLTGIPDFNPRGAAQQVSMEFLAGYMIERALSVDNIFIFAVVFNYFGIPAKYQHRVLFLGIVGALFFRVLFIAAGAALLQLHWINWVFGAFLVLTGLKLFVATEKPVEPEHNWMIKLLRRYLPVWPHFEGQHFLLRKNGILHATPLLVCLVFLEVTDIVFAVDSVPAIFAVTSEPFVVFTSNVFAILGLRAMFFLLAGIMHRFHLLKYGLGMILVFVGLKMAWLNDAFHGQFPISWSLAIIGGVLALAIGASLLWPARHKHDALGQAGLPDRAKKKDAYAKLR